MPLSMQALPATPESLCLVEMTGGGGREAVRDPSSSGKLYLNVGLQNGVLLRTVLDHVSGDLSDTRTRYLGARAVRLFRVKTQGSEAVLAISSRCWLLYYHQSRFHLTPLSYDSLEFASGFTSEQCPEGIVAISSNTLRILALEKLGAVFNQQSFGLTYTPRKFVIHPETGHIVTIETDHNAFTKNTIKNRKQQMAEQMVEAADESEQEAAAEMAANFLNEDLPETTFGAPKAGAGQWASVIRILDPITGVTLDKIELEQNEAAMSIALAKFSQSGDAPYLLIGVARDLYLNPKSVGSGSVHTYQIQEEGKKLQLIHVTPVEDVPYAICGFQGRVLISVGKLIRLYEMGKKKLLKKCENKHFPNAVISIQSLGGRIYAADVQESIYFVRYKRADNQLVIFADDTLPRFVTTTCILDYGTVGIADKFGNLGVVRLPPNADDELDEDPTGVKSLWDRGWLGGSSQKVEALTNFHVGETITSLQKATLIPGLSECLVYFTISGSIGVVVPFSSHEDHEFFQNLEMHMRAENPPLCGRDHLSFRSYYVPSKNVIDGDLCEQYNCIDITKQKSIAEELDRVPAEVSKKLEDIRTQYAF